MARSQPLPTKPRRLRLNSNPGNGGPSASQIAVRALEALGEATPTEIVAWLHEQRVVAIPIESDLGIVLRRRDELFEPGAIAGTWRLRD